MGSFSVDDDDDDDDDDDEDDMDFNFLGGYDVGYLHQRQDPQG